MFVNAWESPWTLNVAGEVSVRVFLIAGQSRKNARSLRMLGDGIRPFFGLICLLESNLLRPDRGDGRIIGTAYCSNHCCCHFQSAQYFCQPAATSTRLNAEPCWPILISPPASNKSDSLFGYLLDSEVINTSFNPFINALYRQER